MMSERVPQRSSLLATYRFEVLLAIILGVLFLFYFFLWQQKAPILRTDSYGYLETSADLQDWSLSMLHRRAPGYPALMRLTGFTSPQDAGTLLYAVQLLLHFGMAGVAVLTLRALKVRQLVPIVVLLVFAAEPLIVGAAALGMSETLTMFLLVVGTCLLFLYLAGRSWPYALLSGVMLSFSALVRPTFQLLLVVIVGVLALAWMLWPYLRRRAVVAGGLNVVFSLLFVGGFILFNQQRFGFSGLTPLAGYNLAKRTPHVLDLIPDKYANVREILIRHRNETITTEPYESSPNGAVSYIWGAIPELKETLHMNDTELAKFLVSLNVDLIRRQPQVYLEEVSMVFGSYWEPFSPAPELIHGRPLILLSGLHFLKFLFIFSMVSALVTVLIMLALARRDVRRALLARLSTVDHVKFIGMTLWLAIGVYNLLISIMMDVGSPRHRLPTDMLLIMTGVVMLDYLLRVRQTLPVIIGRLPPARA